MAKVKASAMCICHYISWQSRIVILPLPPCMTLLCPRTRLQKKHLIIFVNMASLLDTAVCVHARMNEWNIIAQVMFRLVKTWVKTVIFSFLARRKWVQELLGLNPVCVCGLSNCYKEPQSILNHVVAVLNFTRCASWERKMCLQHRWWWKVGLMKKKAPKPDNLKQQIKCQFSCPILFQSAWVLQQALCCEQI